MQVRRAYSAHPHATHRGMAVLESADSHPQPRLLHSNILDGAVLRSDADIVGVHRLIKSRTYVCARGIYADGTQIRSHAPQEERRTERRLGHTHGKAEHTRRRREAFVQNETDGVFLLAVPVVGGGAALSTGKPLSSHAVRNG